LALDHQIEVLRKLTVALQALDIGSERVNQLPLLLCNPIGRPSLAPFKRLPLVLRLGAAFIVEAIDDSTAQLVLRAAPAAAGRLGLGLGSAARVVLAGITKGQTLLLLFLLLPWLLLTFKQFGVLQLLDPELVLLLGEELRKGAVAR